LNAVRIADARVDLAFGFGERRLVIEMQVRDCKASVTLAGAVLRLRSCR
jgi:hypothetical protein